MEQKKNNARPSAPMGLAGILLRTALVLLCMTLLCVHLMGSLFAKYSTHADGSDDARVAKFDVVVTGSPDAVSVDYVLNNFGAYTITITNQSEVAVSYTLSVSVDEALQGTFDQTSGTLAANAAPVNHTLNFTVKNWDTVTQNMTNSNNTFSAGFTVTVHVEQID